MTRHDRVGNQGDGQFPMTQTQLDERKDFVRIPADRPLSDVVCRAAKRRGPVFVNIATGEVLLCDDRMNAVWRFDLTEVLDR